MIKTFKKKFICLNNFLIKNNFLRPRYLPKMIQLIQAKEDLEQQLADAGDKLVVIDFFATWCGPCKIISPKLQELAELHGEKAIVLKVDVDECDEIAQDYNITSMPTFLFIKNKKIIDVFVGGNADKLVSTMSRLVGEPEKPEAVPTKTVPETTAAIEAATTEHAVEKL